MSVKGIVYLVNRVTRHINLAGEVPAVYANITGLADADYSVLRDLGATFGEDYANLGFLTEADALEAGVPQADIDRMKKAACSIKWNTLEQERSDLIQDQRWRIDRHNDQVAMGIELSEDIAPVYKYVQDIRDLTQTQLDPFNIVWPEIPA
jgi:hypothetical protein